MSEASLTRHNPQDMAVAKPVPSVGEMLGAVIERGVTSENVAAIEKLVGLYERMQDKEAEKAFAAAFVALQAEMPKIHARKAVPNSNGTVRYVFAPFEDIMEQVAPVLRKNGFTVSFSTDFGDGRIIKECMLTHIGGHSRTNKFAVRIGKGPPSSSESQADGAASTYAKRFALCDALNIVIDADTDGAAEGDVIGSDLAFELERRVNETNSNRVAFLAFAGAPTFAEIRREKYQILDEYLSKKEKRPK